jgi:hypothetical protein
MAQLREREVPQARVYAYIKDPPYGGIRRRFVELLGFRSVNSNISRVSGGSATVVFPNYKSCLIRYVSAKGVDEIELPRNGEETTNKYAKTFMQDISSEDKAGKLFKGLWNDVVLSDGESGQVVMDEFSDFRKIGRSRGDLLNGEDRNVMAQINKDGYIMALPFISWLDPIFIDYQGQDGFWYAGFTGTVSRVVENYAKTGDQSITLNCRDLGILLDNTQII